MSIKSHDGVGANFRVTNTNLPTQVDDNMNVGRLSELKDDDSIFNEKNNNKS